MLRTPLQSSIGTTRCDWVRRSRPNQGMSVLPGLADLLHGFPRLRQLRVSNIRDVPKAALDELSASNPKLVVIRVET